MEKRLEKQATAPAGPSAVLPGQVAAPTNYVRADAINLADIDRELARLEEKGRSLNIDISGLVNRRKFAWEIDPNKIFLKNMVGKGTYGTVYRASYNGGDVAGLNSCTPDRLFIETSKLKISCLTGTRTLR